MLETVKRVICFAGVFGLVSFVCLSVSVPAPAIPLGRAYEQVSPFYKAGYGVGTIAVAPDGESLMFSSHGAFAGVPWPEEGTGSNYVARRGAIGWGTMAVSAPPVSSLSDVSANLEYVLAEEALGVSKEGDVPVGTAYLLRRADALAPAESWELFGGVEMKVLGDEFLGTGAIEGRSADLCHIVLGLAEGPLLPEAEGAGSTQIYDLSGAPAGDCRGGSQPLRLASVKNALGSHGEPEPISRECYAEPGVGNRYADGQLSTFSPLADGGEMIFFTQGLSEAECSHHQLFVRLGGDRTVEVSKPMEEAEGCGDAVPCPGALSRASADFSGAAEDGSRVYFTTRGSLVGGDEDTANDLYMAEIGCGESESGCGISERQVTGLVQVSHDPHVAEAAEVQGVMRVAPDGARVYFVAHGVLGEGANTEDQTPVSGADNLYVYDAKTGKTVFVADLCSGSGESGRKVVDSQCPNELDGVSRDDVELWGNAQEVQSNEDGRFLVFSSYARLVRSDTDDAKDIYRYDAMTGALSRVSVGEDGSDENGNRDDVGGNASADATIPLGGINPGPTNFQSHEMATHAITEDGSRIVFSTDEPLSPGAVNGLANIYEWHAEAGEAGGGQVSLVSSGSSPTLDAGAMITPSGDDVFFETTAQLGAQDADENVDIYDARLPHVAGEQVTFPPAPAVREPCSGDACQGPLTNPAPLLVPGSVSQVPGENLTPPKQVSPKKKVKKKLPVSKKRKRIKRKVGRVGRVVGRSGGRGE